MGLTLLIVCGALTGWLATIILKVEDGHEIGRYVIFGLGGAMVAGVVAANGLVLGSVTALTLLAGFVGAVLAIAVYAFFNHRTPVR